MAYNTKAIKRDTNEDAIPQFFDAAADDYYVLLGKNGVGPHYIPFDTAGDELFTASNRGKVDVHSPLPAGTNAIGSVDVDNFPTSIEVENPTGESLDVQVTGSNMELWGADVGSRPAYNAVSVGTIFIAINGGAHEAWQSDGTEWVEV